MLDGRCPADLATDENHDDEVDKPEVFDEVCECLETVALQKTNKLINITVPNDTENERKEEKDDVTKQTENKSRMRIM